MGWEAGRRWGGGEAGVDWGGARCMLEGRKARGEDQGVEESVSNLRFKG